MQTTQKHEQKVKMTDKYLCIIQVWSEDVIHNTCNPNCLYQMYEKYICLHLSDG